MPEVFDPWVVWSFEHDSWWGPSHHGYYNNLVLAGIYSRTEAQAIERNANAHMKDDKISEQAMPLRNALEFEVQRWMPGRVIPHPSDPIVADHIGFLQFDATT